ncbi:MAG: GDP-mannose 4,6-dehydratase [Thermoguttaceae bacterium]|nr:GDP-mannose 4,6-dehydratase [Thermoguttaceae bacterium]
MSDMYIVTGCAGFIASKLTQNLLEQGNDVLGIDVLNDAYDCRLKNYRIKNLTAFPIFRFKKGDIADKDFVFKQVKSCKSNLQAIYNLAARAGVRTSVVNPWIYYHSNALGSLNILDACREFSVPKYVMASTSSLYGNCPNGKFSETDCTDKPLSPYAASKKAAEAMAFSYHHLHGIDVSILRYFTVYGPAGRPDMSMFRFIRHIDQGEPIILFGDGTQERDFTYVDDIARGTQLAEKKVGYDIFNLGGDNVVVLNDLIALIGRLLGKEVIIDYRPAHRADVKRTSANIDHARKVLKWSPKTSIEKGVEKTIQWYKENRALALKIDLGE